MSNNLKIGSQPLCPNYIFILRAYNMILCCVTCKHRQTRHAVSYNGFRWSSIRIFIRLPKHISMISSCSIDKFKSQLEEE